MFEHPAVRKLDYFWRLDTDSFILAPVRQDLFRFMAERDLKYGFRVEMRDTPDVTDGLEDFVEAYMASHPAAAEQAERNGLLLTPPEDRVVEGAAMYYNNFEVVHVPTFSKQADLQDFVKAVDETHHIFNRRWGDAPLRYYACNLFLSRNELHHFCDIDYLHQSHFLPDCDAQ